MSDFRTDIVNIIKSSSFYNKSSNNTLYCYPDIPDKMVKKFKKHLSPYINVNGIAVLIDTTLFKSGKQGIVFTTTGVYFNQLFIKKNYFNYADIEDISYDNIYIKVKLKNGTTIDVSDVEYYKDDLIKVLYRLRDYVAEQRLSSKRESGNLKKTKMPKDLSNKCNAIIHSASVAAGGVGAGLAQLPCSDSAVITPIQIGMIIGLGQVFELDITDGMAKGILAGLSGAFVGRGIVQVAVGWIIGVGNAINTATAAGLTEAIGWTAANQFYQQSLDNSAKYSLDGEKRGYNNASELYEKKLRDQAVEFFRQKKVCEEEKDELNALIDEYEKYIREHQMDSNDNSNSKVIVMEREIEELKNLRSISMRGGL